MGFTLRISPCSQLSLCRMRAPGCRKISGPTWPLSKVRGRPVLGRPGFMGHREWPPHVVLGGEAGSVG